MQATPSEREAAQEGDFVTYDLNFPALWPYWPQFLDGIRLTLALTAAATTLGLCLSILVAIGRRSDSPALRTLCGIYVEVLRNTPFIVQIFIFYFGLSSAGIQMSAAVAAALAMVINVGAYGAEIVRAGMDAVPPGQIEAAECLGLSRPRIYWHVVMQPSLERVYPALTSQFVLMMLMSSVASQISTEELSAVANNIQSDTYLSLETYIVVAALYVVLALLLKLCFWAIGEAVFRRRRMLRQAARHNRIAVQGGA